MRKAMGLLALVILAACGQKQEPFIDADPGDPPLVDPLTCVDDESSSGVALETPDNFPGPFDYRQTCDFECPVDLRAGGAPNDACTTAADCAETCCACSGTKAFAAAACLNGTCRFPQTACAVACDQGDLDACPGEDCPPH